MITKIKKNKLKIGNILFIIFIFCPSLSFSQQDNLCIKGTLQTQTLTIKGSDTLPASPTKGEIYYKTDEDTIYFYDGSQWQKIGEGQDKTVASQIVRTQNSRYDADKTCDGTDDQQEIQQAINDLGNDKGAVYLLEGEYLVSNAIQLEYGAGFTFTPDRIGDSYKSIIGTGAGSILKVNADADFCVFKLYYGRKGCALMSNFQIDGNKASVTGKNCGISLGGWYQVGFKYSIVDNVWIKDLTSWGITLVNRLSIYTDNYILSGIDCKDALRFGSGSKGLSIFSNNFITPQIHFYGYGGGSMQCDIISLNIFPSGNIDLYGYCAYCSRHILLGNIVPGGNIVTRGINPRCNHLVVCSNLLSGGGGGINYSGGKSMISNNLIKESSFPAINYNGAELVFSNMISESATGGFWADCGIYVTAPSLISSNYIYDSVCNGGYYYGIIIWHPFLKNIYIVGNYIQGNYTHPIYDRPSSTFYTDKLKLTLEGKPLDISNSTYTLDMTTNPRTYFQLNPQVDTTLSLQDGKSPGDLLILENTSSSYTITISESRNIELEKNTLTLGENDTLMLLWDGTKWIQTAYADN